MQNVIHQSFKNEIVINNVIICFKINTCSEESYILQRHFQLGFLITNVVSDCTIIKMHFLQPSTKIIIKG
jgi:hypothetical protein